ncbi:hypothetical protein ABBQ32_001826 [Trebouxia sp. C0010 RCD-2024]
MRAVAGNCRHEPRIATAGSAEHRHRAAQLGQIKRAYARIQGEGTSSFRPRLSVLPSCPGAKLEDTHTTQFRSVEDRPSELLYIV